MRATRLGCAARMFPLVLALAAGCKDATGPGTGTIRISVTTTGDDIDADDYAVIVDGRPRGVVRANGSVAISRVEPGPRIARLQGVAPNCSVDGGPDRRVTVAAGQEVTATFAVSCTALIGSLRVTTATSGDEPDATGYTVELAQVIGNGTGPFGGGQPVGANGSVTIPNLRAGTYMLRLADVALNCGVLPPVTPVVTVAFGATAEVTFTVRCVAPGSLRVTTATSGPDPDPDGYTASIEGSSLNTSARLPTSGTVTTSVAPGSYVVTLTGLAENCEPGGPRKQVIDVSARDTAVVAFGVACAPVTPLAFVSERDGNPEIYVVNANGTGLTRLTNDGARDLSPAWSPDGSRIAFSSDLLGNQNIYVMNADGSSVVRRTSGPGSNTHPAWSPDGRTIAFVSTRDGNYDIYVVPADGDASDPVRLTSGPGASTDPAWSPDGSKIAFTSTRSGSSDIYVMNADGSGVTVIAQSSSGESYSRPAWSPDGRRLAVVQFRCDYYCYYYYGDSPDAYSVSVINADGTGALSFIATSAFDDAAPTWSPDGRTLALSQEVCDGGRCATSVFYVRVDRTGADLIVPDGYSPAWRR